MKKLTSIRINEALHSRAKDAGLNISQLIEEYLRVIFKINKCPTCKQKLKVEKKAS